MDDFGLLVIGGGINVATVALVQASAAADGSPSRRQFILG